MKTVSMAASLNSSINNDVVGINMPSGDGETATWAGRAVVSATSVARGNVSKAM